MIGSASATSRSRASQRPGVSGHGEAVVLAIVMFVAVATGATGLALGRDRLGVATPPFVADWAPRLHPLAAVSVLVLAAACAAAPRLLDARVRPVIFAAAVWALALALGLALNSARLGTAGWSAVFDLDRGGEAVNEYLPGLPAIGYGVRFYLDRFAEIVPSQPVNVAGHPPGPLLLVHALGIRSADGLAALCIGAGSLTAPLTYALARALHSDRTARVAALLLAFSPVVLLDGVTSFDYVFAALGTGAAALLLTRRFAGAAALGVAALFSWALLGVAAWAALVVARRDGLRAAFGLAAACAIAVAALNTALAGAYGYDPVATLRATAAVYDHSIASTRPYAYWLFGSLVAWGVMLGPPIAAAALCGLARREDAAVALGAVLLVAAIAGFTKAETERIWLFLAPLACIAAAPALAGEWRPALTLALLAAQALIVEAFFATVW
jgi:methylthioxylose transferase